MEFWEFTVCMYCILSGGDIARYVEDNKWSQLPISEFTRKAFDLIGFIPGIGVFALPIYGFIVMAWWQPIAGFFLAAAIVGVTTRKMLASSPYLAIWAMFFSVLGVIAFAGFQFG